MNPNKIFNRGVAAKFFQPTGEKVTINDQDVVVYQRDDAGNVLFAVGIATISDGAAGYAKGCLYVDTDIGAGSSGVYENVGTVAACNFDLIGGAGGVTTFVQLTDTPANYAGAANKVLKVNAAGTAVEFVTMSGDATIGATGTVSVSDLTIAGEAQGDLLQRGAAAWEKLTAVQGDLIQRGASKFEPITGAADGDVLRYSLASQAWTLVDPATLPAGIASGLAQSFTMEGGANDITVTVTAQTVGACALTIPDFASVADTYAFVTLAQTFANKTLTTPVIASFYQDAGKTKLMTTPNTASDTLCAIAATQTLTNKTLTTPVIASIYQDAGKTQLMSLPNTASDTLCAIAATQTLTNKTLTTPIIASMYQDAGKTQLMTLPNVASDTFCVLAAAQTLTTKTINADSNTITNINGDELDPVTVPVTEAAVYSVPVVFMGYVNNEVGAVKMLDSAPFKMMLVRAWSINASADGGTWKLLNNASADMTDVVTVAASDKDVDYVGQIDDATATIDAGQDLWVSPNGTLDAYIFAEFVRID